MIARKCSSDCLKILGFWIYCCLLVIVQKSQDHQLPDDLQFQPYKFQWKWRKLNPKLDTVSRSQSFSQNGVFFQGFCLILWTWENSGIWQIRINKYNVYASSIKLVPEIWMPLKSTAPHSFSQTNKAPPITRVFLPTSFGNLWIESTLEFYRNWKNNKKTLLKSLDPSNMSGLVCIQQIGIVIEAFSPGAFLCTAPWREVSKGVLQAPTCKAGRPFLVVEL